MKKLMFVLMSLMLCFGLTACAKTDNVPGTVEDNGTVVKDTTDNNALDKTEDTLEKDVNDLTGNTTTNNGTTVTP